MAFPRWAKITTIIVGALVVYNGLVTVPVILERSDEQGVTMVAYRRWLVDPTTVVIDMWKLDGNRSMADVDRNLFKVAEAIKSQPFGRVQLAYQGRGRFLIPGHKFREIGKEWRSQSVAYLVSVLPQSATKLNGEPAFGTWSGGFLGVIMHQLQDHNQLHWAWYLASMTGANPESTMPDRPAT